MSDTLAINGGTPIRTKPWEESNSIGEEEKKAAIRVLESKNLSLFQGAYKPRPPYNFLGGPEVQALETLVAQKFSVKHVMAVNSASSGLYAAIGALGLGFGDEVIVSPYTMSVCAMAPLLYGAIPVFADLEEGTGCLDPKSIRERLTPRTKAILVVHQFGIPADMDGIMAIAKEHNLKVIEDCAQAWGATYRGKNVGTIGDVGVYSLNVHKTIQSGEGGLCVTNNDETAIRIQMIRNHAESVAGDIGHAQTPNLIGFNYRMTEVQAAIANEQFKKLDWLNEKRVEFAAMVTETAKKFPCLAPPQFGDERKPTYYVYPLRYLSKNLKNIPRAEFNKALAAEGISFAEGYVKPLYLLPVFQNKTAFTKGYPWSAPENRDSNPSYAEGTCPVTERLYKDEMMLNLFMCHPQEKADVEDIVKGLTKVITAM